jgi:hypothetical protein
MPHNTSCVTEIHSASFRESKISYDTSLSNLLSVFIEVVEAALSFLSHFCKILSFSLSLLDGTKTRWV